jgi:hypothetical protein
MDALAQEMYEKSGLATEALRKLYADTQAAQVQALAEEATAYANAQADIQAKFNSTMEKITADRDAAIKEANDTLTAALKDATDALTTALGDAEKEFKDKLKSMGAAVKSFKAEIAALKAELSGIDSSKIITPISGGSVGAPVPESLGVTSVSGALASGQTSWMSGVTFNNTFNNNNTVDANTLTQQQMNAVKMNAPYVIAVGNTTRSAWGGSL